jgi:hypothetical protein
MSSVTFLITEYGIHTGDFRMKSASGSYYASDINFVSASVLPRHPYETEEEKFK